jgi:anti-sigma B factor antagonist
MVADGLSCNSDVLMTDLHVAPRPGNATSVWHCTLAGDYDLSRQENLRNLARAFLHDGAPNAIVDCTEVTFMGSDGMSFFGQLIRITRDRQGSVTLVAPPAPLRKVLEITALDKHLILT